MPPTQPNLFQYGPSELSQDAFLAWLVAWARPQHAGEALHEAAKAFILHLHGLAQGAKAIVTPPTEQPAPVASDAPGFEWLGGPYLQLDKIDLCFEVRLGGVPHLFLIEDKTHSGEHSGQLTRYGDAAKARFKDHRRVSVYYKTGLITNDHDSAGGAGYLVFALDAAEGILRQLQAQHGITHGVYLDYLAHLQQQLAERQAWERQFLAQPNWAWLSDDLQGNEDLLSETGQAPGSLWQEGHASQSQAKLRLRATLLQWAFMARLKAKLMAQGPHGNCLHQYRGTSAGRPWTQLRFWNDPRPDSLGEGLFYRLDRDKAGLYLSIRHYHRGDKADAAYWAGKKARGADLASRWAEAAKQLGFQQVAAVGNKGTFEREIAHIPLSRPNPKGEPPQPLPTAAEVEALLDQVAAVHRAFAQGLPAHAPLAGAQA